MKIRSTHIVLILMFLFTAATLGGSAYLFHLIQTMRAEYIASNIELETEKENQRLQSKIKQGMMEIASEREELKQYFYREQDTFLLIRQLEELASDAGVDITFATAAVTGNTAKIFRVDFSVKGPWRNVAHYITMFENIPLRVHVNRFSLLALGEKAEEWKGDISFELLSFIPTE